MHYLGIDQSLTSTGIVVLDESLAMIHYEAISTSSQDSVYQRTWLILKRIQEIITKHEVNLVAIEGLAMNMTGNATRSLAILQGVIVTNLLFDPPSNHHLNKKSLEIVTPSQLKKFATGKGKASKKDMINALPSSVRDTMLKSLYKKSIEDLADAYFLAKYLYQFQHKMTNYKAKEKIKICLRKRGDHHPPLDPPILPLGEVRHRK